MLYLFLLIYIPFKNINIISDRNVYNQNLTFFPFNIHIWGIERSGFFNGREKWAKGFENQRV